MLRRQLVTGNMKLKITLAVFSYLILVCGQAIAATTIPVTCTVWADPNTSGDNHTISLGEGISLDTVNLKDQVSSLRIDGDIDQGKIAYLKYWTWDKSETNGYQGYIYKMSDGHYESTYKENPSITGWLEDSGGNHKRNDDFDYVECGLINEWGAVIYADPNKRGGRMYLEPKQMTPNLDKMSLNVSSLELNPNYEMNYSLRTYTDITGTNLVVNDVARQFIFKRNGIYGGAGDTNPEEWLSDYKIKRNDNFKYVTVHKDNDLDKCRLWEHPNQQGLGQVVHNGTSIFSSLTNPGIILNYSTNAKSTANFLKSVSSVSFDRDPVTADQVAYIQYTANGGAGTIYKTANGYESTYRADASIDWLEDEVLFEIYNNNQHNRNDNFTGASCGFMDSWKAILYRDQNLSGPRMYLELDKEYNLTGTSLEKGLYKGISSLKLKPGYQLEFTIDNSNVYQSPIVNLNGTYQGAGGTNPEAWLSDSGITRNDNFVKVKVTRASPVINMAPIISLLLDEDDPSAADLDQLKDSIDHGKSFLKTIQDKQTLPHNILPINGDYIIEEGNGEWVGLKLIDTTLYIYKKGSQLPSAEDVADFFAELFIRSLFPNNPCVQKYSHGFIQNKTSQELLTNANKNELKDWEENGVLEECSIALTFEPSLSFLIRTQNLNISDYLDALEAYHLPVHGNEFRSRKLQVFDEFSAHFGLVLKMGVKGVDINTGKQVICETDVTDPSNCSNTYVKHPVVESVVEISTNNSSYAEYEDYQEAMDWGPMAELNGMCDVLRSINGQTTDASVHCTTRVKALCEHNNNGTQELIPTVESYSPTDPDAACIFEYGPYSRATTRKRARDGDLTLYPGIGAGFSYSKRTRTTESQKIVAVKALNFVNKIKSDLELETKRRNGASILQIHSLNIGAGSCHLVQCFEPETEVSAGLSPPQSYLIDCGSKSSALERLDAPGVKSYLKNREVDKGTLDIVVSHPDIDHYNFLTSLAGIVQIDKLWLGGDIQNNDNYRGEGSNNLIPYIWDNIHNFVQINGKNIPNFTARNDDTGYSEGIDNFTREIPEWIRPSTVPTQIKSFDACHTKLSLLNVNHSNFDGSYSERNDNADSAVIMLQTSRETDTSPTKDILALFPGDAHGSTELFAKDLLPADGILYETRLIMASHHGAESNNSNSDEWVSSISPTDVVFSSGTNLTYKHPRKTIIDRYLDTFSLFWLEKFHALYFGDFSQWQAKTGTDESDQVRLDTWHSIFSTASSGTIVHTFIIPEDAAIPVVRFVNYQYDEPTFD